MDAELNPALLPVLSQRFQALVWACIDSDLNRSAVFFSERYFALNQECHDARHLYATALLREGQPHSALCLVNISKGKQCPGCLDLKAKCSTALGRYREAHHALQESMGDSLYHPPEPRQGSKPFSDEATLLCRAGTMALKGNLTEKATSHFLQSLSLNPLIWEALEGLCTLGSLPDLDIIFPPRPPPIKRMMTADEQHTSTPLGQNSGFFSPDPLFPGWKHDSTQPFRIPAISRDSILSNDSLHPHDNTFQQAHRSSRSQPTIPGGIHLPSSRPLSSADETGPATKKLRSTARQADGPRSRYSKSVDESIKKPSSSRTTLGKNIPSTSNAGTRQSSRLLRPKQQHGAKTSTRERKRKQYPGSSLSVESGMDDDSNIAVSPSPPAIAQSPRSDRSPSPPQEQATQEAYEIEWADHYIYNLTRRFASATRALSMYKSQQCITELEQLPATQQKTPWVLAMVGKAHYEKADYGAAERAFKAVRTLEPYRLWDMEVYSTLLWHLQRPTELSFLAQELLNINPRSAQAWIAIGNLFSLQKERSQALTCFRRATQMDPSCAYAYTLSGHETIDEDLDKSINFFQSALRVDPRHYNAWYGLGTCYLRMSKIRLAEYHYRKAVEIHPHNAVLLGCVGMAVERRGDRAGALALFDGAVDLAPDNALVRYRRAKILILMKKYDHAIKDLEYLRSTSPEESNVVFQLAKAYRLVGNETKSAQLLAIARDISPKSISKIKKLLETVKDETEDRMEVG